MIADTTVDGFIEECGGTTGETEFSNILELPEGENRGRQIKLRGVSWMVTIVLAHSDALLVYLREWLELAKREDIGTEAWAEAVRGERSPLMVL